MVMHPQVREVVEDYLARADAEAPGLVEGLYLTGSIALDDYQPGASDIDFVAVTRDPMSRSDLAALERVHTALRSRQGPVLDGPYVTWRDLARDPALADPVPHVHDGRFHPGGTGWDPVTWHILARHGVVVRGPHRKDLDVWLDREGLDRWLRENLDTYWRPWLRRARRLWSRPGLGGLTSWGPAWGVLGVSRIHCTLATGEIVSKDRAGDYARETFGPRWHSIVDECLRIRRGNGPKRYRSRFRRRRDALDFVAMAIDTAYRIG